MQTLLRLGRKYLDELNPNDMTFKSAPPDCLRRALEQARIAFIEFLKPWLSSVNPDDLQQKINTLIDGIQSERDIKQMALSVFDLLGNLLHHPSYANSSQASQRTRQLQQQVEDLKSKHSEWWKTLKDLLGLVEATLAEVAEDQDLQQIGKSAQSISLAILDVTRKGIFTFLGDTTGLISDVLNILLPRLLRTLTDWPFPRIEYASPSVEAVVCRFLFFSDNDLSHDLLEV